MEFTSTVTGGSLLAYRITNSVQPSFCWSDIPTSLNPTQFIAAFSNMPPNVDSGTVQTTSHFHTRFLECHFIILTFMSRSPQGSSLCMFPSQYSALCRQSFHRCTAEWHSIVAYCDVTVSFSLQTVDFVGCDKTDPQYKRYC